MQRGAPQAQASARRPAPPVRRSRAGRCFAQRLRTGRRCGPCVRAGRCPRASTRAGPEPCRRSPALRVRARARASARELRSGRSTSVVYVRSVLFLPPSLPPSPPSPSFLPLSLSCKSPPHPLLFSLSWAPRGGRMRATIPLGCRVPVGVASLSRPCGCRVPLGVTSLGATVHVPFGPLVAAPHWVPLPCQVLLGCHGTACTCLRGRNLSARCGRALRAPGPCLESLPTLLSGHSQSPYMGQYGGAPTASGWGEDCWTGPPISSPPGHDPSHCSDTPT